MVSVEHDWYRARPAVLAMLAAVSVRACWLGWESAAGFEVEPEFESHAARSDVDPEGYSKLWGAVAGSYWEVAWLSRRIGPAVGDVGSLEPAVGLPGLRERRLDRLPDLVMHPAAVRGTDQMADHAVVMLIAGEPVGLVSYSFEVEDD